MRLYGKRPVAERLRAAPATMQHIYLEEQGDTSEIAALAHAAGRRVTILAHTAFAKRVGAVHAQGVLAEVEPFQYADLDTLLERTPPLTVLFLDRVTDPQNVGNILRTMACLGGVGLVLPKHDSAEINETVLRVACGGENYVPVARVTNLVQATERAKRARYWIAGAVSDGGTPLAEVQWPAPLGLVVGAEGSGIRPGLAKHLELTVTLPLRGAALSLNVATAAALVVYEVQRARDHA